MMKRLLIAESDRFSTEALRRLAPFLDVQTCGTARTDLERAIASADILWVRLRHFIDAPLLDCAPNLRVIVTATTGLNHIDMKAASARGIAVLSLRGETDFLRHVYATAELTLTLMLALLRHIPSAVFHVLQGGWDRDAFRGGELTGRTVGIIGYGRLGRAVARYLAPFRCTVLAADRPAAPIFPELGVDLVSLDQLLSCSDIVSLHVSLSKDTVRMIDAGVFRRMKQGAKFVNTARGELVDEPALLEALESGRLTGAALDVLTGEQSLDSLSNPVLSYARTHSNLIITPHIGGCTNESMVKAENFMSRRLIEWIERNDPPSPFLEVPVAHRV